MSGQINRKSSGKYFKKNLARKPFTPKIEFPKIKEGWIGLLPDGSNGPEWKESCCTNTEEKFGWPGKCLRAEGYFERETRSVDDWRVWAEIAGNDPLALQTAKAKYADRYLQQLADDQTEYGRIFGMITTTLHKDSITRLEALANWRDARDNNDPVEAMAIIDTNIVMGLVGLPQGEQRNTRMRQFYRREQMSGEPIEEYLVAHERIRNDLSKLEHPQLPTEADACLVAVEGITDSKDIEWANVIRQKNRDGEDVPMTYDDLLVSRRSYISVNAPHVASTVYGISAYSQSTSTSEATKKKCFYCDKAGHFSRECKKRMADEAAEDGDDTDATASDKKIKDKGTKKRKVRAKALSIKCMSSSNKKSKSFKNLLFIDSLSDHNFHFDRELLSNETTMPLHVEGVGGEYEVEHGILADMWCFGQSAYLEDAGRNAVAEYNLHRFKPRHKIGKYWRITLSTGHVFFTWRPEYKAYATPLDETTLSKLRGAGSSENRLRMNHYSTTVAQCEKDYPKAEVKRA